jgi:hypothetical protein
MAMYESPQRVCVEFLKSSSGRGRVIKLNYTPEAIPAQLVGRMDPVSPLTVSVALAKSLS